MADEHRCALPATPRERQRAGVVDGVTVECVCGNVYRWYRTGWTQVAR